jgi:molybdopterin-guanine dinucleotide biosynthesis protein A
MYEIPAVIFAGGKSSRMGRDKALLPFGNEESLAAYQFHRLSVYFPEVYLSSKSAKFPFDAPIIYDRYDESSPLVALISIFETLACDEIFILGVDMPFVHSDVISALYAHHRETHDAIIAQSPQGLQPLCGIYRRTILPHAHRQLAAQNHKLQQLLESSDTLAVKFSDDQPFVNLNTPQEYQSWKP